MQWFRELTGLVLVLSACGAAGGQEGKYVLRDHYEKRTVRIRMRDGVHLHTIIYSPRDKTRTYPVLLKRTPYGIAPYGEKEFPAALGPNPRFPRAGYIFVYQDVRGCYMSEGTFENMRPHRTTRKSDKDIDESTDTYDTIDWLVDNVPGHNGKVGMWGISYPGFYCSAGMIDAHPALKAVSPQAPIADWFFDDFFHHGAFFLPHAFHFFSRFGPPRPEPTTKRGFSFDYKTRDGYDFYLSLGSLKNVDERHFKKGIPYWNVLADHPNYDDFWKARNILPHLRKVAPAVLVVGGWYDAEDLYGIFNTYRAVEKQNPGIFNALVVGPWDHGGWARKDSSSLGHIHFGSNTAAFFQSEIEFPFFEHRLRGKPDPRLPEAFVFETGTNRWRRFERWPPAPVRTATFFLHPGGKVSLQPPRDVKGPEAHDEFVSDPHRPVPYTQRTTTAMSREYMTDDQRFASRRPDVLVYESDVLPCDLTVAGPLTARLFVSTTGTDADWIVKVIDVHPEDSRGADDKDLSGYQQPIRSEVFRGRFRNDYSRPEPFVPGQIYRVAIPLQDVLHTFKAGHRILIQVHSTWFPLVDRNPQKFVPNIFRAEPEDFVKATHRVWRSADHPSRIEVGILEETPSDR